MDFPTVHEFTTLVDSSLLHFITLLIRVFFALAMVLSLFFAAAIALLYCSSKLLIFGYVLVSRIAEIASQKKNSGVTQ